MPLAADDMAKSCTIAQLDGCAMPICSGAGECGPAYAGGPPNGRARR
jgi:hypothetical protein